MLTLKYQNSEGDEQIDQIQVKTLRHMYLRLTESKIEFKYDSSLGQQDMNIKISKTTPKQLKPIHDDPTYFAKYIFSRIDFMSNLYWYFHLYG